MALLVLRRASQYFVRVGCFSTANGVSRSLCNIEEFKFFHVLVIDASECADGHASVPKVDILSPHI